MHTLSLVGLCALATLGSAASAAAQSITETFDGPNVDQWGIDLMPDDATIATGGNPGGRLFSTVNSAGSFLPSPMLHPRAPGHPWGGNYATLGVESFQYDRQVEQGSSNFGTIPHLLLGNDNGTPGDFLDDTWVYTATGDLFQFGFVPWETFLVPIDSQSLVMPAGWGGAGLPNSPLAGALDDDVWNAVIQDVTYIGITPSLPWMGGPWFGIHDISYDNFELGIAGLDDTYCGPAVANSTGLPGTIFGVGSTTASNNNLTLVGSNLPEGQFAYFLGSRTQGFFPNPSGSQGNLCLAGALARFNAQLGQVQGGGYSIQVDLTDIPEPPAFGVAVMAGETWNFQLWYRDFLVGQGATSNFTEGLTITFQ